VFALALLLVIPARALVRPEPRKEVDMVFYRPKPVVQMPAPANPLPKAPVVSTGRERIPRPAAAIVPPKPNPSAPEGPGQPDKPPGPENPPQQKIGSTGILAFRDKFAALTQDRVTPHLGRDARITDADNSGKTTSNSMLTANAPGSSGGIDLATLKRSVGGGGGTNGGPGGGGAGGGGPFGDGHGVEVGRETSPIAPGGDRPLSHGGPGPARTDEEIQIVFDRYKASFYRLYNRELRKDPTLKGQMVLRLTIEPDGSVSMCKLQSSDMNAPDLADQVVGITKTINFGAKDGVQALTISYPIDFLPAS
jgi:hypothetical protein